MFLIRLILKIAQSDSLKKALSIMVERKSPNFEVFSLLFAIMKLFGLSKYSFEKNLRSELFTRLRSLILMLIFLHELFTEAMKPGQKGDDSTTLYAREVDRYCRALLSMGLCADATFRRKRDQEIIKAFDEVDEVLLHTFGVKLRYKWIKLMFLIITLILTFPFVLLIHKLYARLNIIDNIHYVIFCVGQFILLIYKFLHLMMTVQFLIRFKIIEKLFNEKSEAFLIRKQFFVFNLFRKIRHLMVMFNGSFGFITLLNICKTLF